MTGYIVAIIIIVLIGNAIIVFTRMRKNRTDEIEARENRIAAGRRSAELLNRDEREQEEAAKHIELRNKTLELYERVRRNAKIADKQKAAIVEQDPMDID